MVARLFVVIALVGTAGVVSVGCSAFSGTDDEPGPGSSDTSDDGSVVSDAGVSEDASRRPVDCDATYCRAPNERYIFVTTASLRGDFARDGGSAVAIAKDLCRQQADDDPARPALAGREWEPWLCTSEDAASGHAAQVNAKWIRPDGIVVFSTTDALRAGTPEQPILPASIYVWTGCSAMPVGEPAVGSTCSDWTTTDGGGACGVAGQPDNKWSAYAITACSLGRPFYCLER